MAVIIRVVEHTRSPGGRFVSDGPFSGEWFRNEVLVPALKDTLERAEQLVVLLDGTSGYGSSFLEEAFGGLVRYNLFPREKILSSLDVRSTDPLYYPYKILVDRYIRTAKPNLVMA